MRNCYHCKHRCERPEGMLNVFILDGAELFRADCDHNHFAGELITHCAVEGRIDFYQVECVGWTADENDQEFLNIYLCRL